MSRMRPSPRRRPSRSSRVARMLVTFLAVCLVAAIGAGAVTLLSADETRRLCDAAVSEGVTSAAAATAIVAAADDVLHEEQRGSRAEHARSHGRMLAERVTVRRERTLEAAWVPRCAVRDDVEVVRAQTRAIDRSATALEHAVAALRAAHPHGRR